MQDSWKMYQVIIKHDQGQAILKVYASSLQNAKDKVMIAEGCPASAIHHAFIDPQWYKAQQKEQSRIKKFGYGV